MILYICYDIRLILVIEYVKNVLVLGFSRLKESVHELNIQKYEKNLKIVKHKRGKFAACRCYEEKA